MRKVWIKDISCRSGSFFCGKMTKKTESGIREPKWLLDGEDTGYVIKNNRKLRLGYTTGSCAAAAAKAASLLLFGIREPGPSFLIDMMTPGGICLRLEPEQMQKGEGWACCGIRKDGGDDPDVTDGMLIFARVEKVKESGIFIDGGEGVGRVTRKGLDQPPGSAAINRIPREMIRENVEEVCRMAHYEGGISVCISAPEGAERARKTFNPRLGITGGISILGTSGIVEPMSERALIKTMETEIRQQLENGKSYLLFTLGNYGSEYLRKEAQLPVKDSIQCSNYVGEAMDMAAAMGAKGILFIAHIGKFIKVAGGIMDTHSRNGDCRAEIMAACAIRAGFPYESVKKILNAVTTDEAIEIAGQTGKQKELITEILEKIQYYMDKRVYHRLPTGALLFSNIYGYLGETEQCQFLIRALSEAAKQEK